MLSDTGSWSLRTDAWRSAAGQYKRPLKNSVRCVRLGSTFYEPTIYRCRVRTGSTAAPSVGRYPEPALRRQRRRPKERLGNFFSSSAAPVVEGPASEAARPLTRIRWITRYKLPTWCCGAAGDVRPPEGRKDRPGPEDGRENDRRLAVDDE